MINLRSHAGGKHRLTVARCQTVRSLFVVDGDGELAVRQSLRRTGQHDGQSAHDDTDNNLSFQHECSLEPSPISVESNILTSDKPCYLPRSAFSADYLNSSKFSHLHRAYPRRSSGKRNIELTPCR